MRQIRPALSRGNGHGQFEQDGGSEHCRLPPDTLGHLAASLKAQCKRYRKRLKQCQKHFSEDAVHHSRVETRRLLSLVELLASFIPASRVHKIKAALKRHLDTFDDLRDTQVQLPAVERMLRAFPAARDFHKYLLRREDRFTKRTRRAIKCVKTSRLGDWLNASRKEIAAQGERRNPRTINTSLLRSVERAFHRTRELRGRIDPDVTATIHCTRVAFKKFRYMVETLAQYLPHADKKFLAAMHSYQTMMGNIQDAQVLLQTFDKYLLKRQVESKAARSFRRELVRRRQELVRAYLAASGQLLQFWPPVSAAAAGVRSSSFSLPEKHRRQASRLTS